MVAKAVICLFAAAVAMKQSECEATLGTFSEEDVSQLNAVDLDTAQLRLVPRYRKMCSNFDDGWDAVEARLKKRRRVIEQNSQPTHAHLAPMSVWRVADL